ncbi:MAG TPA: hypothetical protein VGF48_17225 [Thermoanaerobaculia bacterium]
MLTPTYNRAFTYDDVNRLVTADAGSALWKQANLNAWGTPLVSAYASAQEEYHRDAP